MAETIDVVQEPGSVERIHVATPLEVTAGETALSKEVRVDTGEGVIEFYDPNTGELTDTYEPEESE